jgi:hypothetical protein
MRNDLREIATRQRGIIFCIMGYILCAALQFAVPPPLKIICALAAFGVSIAGMVFVFMLALAMYSKGMGILLGILTLIPLVGLIVLLTVNGKATRILREHGIQVGFFGAKADQIPTAGPPRV